MAFVALIRGINVGGRFLPKADLRAIFSAAGCEDVRTYIQSGNVLFTRPVGARPDFVEDLERRLREHLGGPSSVVVCTGAELDAVVNGNPFSGPETHLHVAFVTRAVTASSMSKLEAASRDPEQFAIGGDPPVVYLRISEGFARAKLPAALLRLEPSATIRNWRTVRALAELAR